MTDFLSLAHAPLILPVSGEGLWSQPGHPQQVAITRLCWGDMIEVIEDGTYGDFGGEFELHFSDWDIAEHGLIYTDKGFLAALRAWFTQQGIAGAESIEYTEQGMQGSEFVSLQAGAEFARSLIAHTWA